MIKINKEHKQLVKMIKINMTICTAINGTKIYRFINLNYNPDNNSLPKKKVIL